MDKLKHMVRLLICLLALAGSAELVLSQADSLAYKPVYGRIIDSRTEKPVVFASVYLEGTNIGTVSNSEGDFILKVPLFIENKTIVISSIGYRNIEMDVYSFSEGKSQAIKLEPGSIPIEQVTIVNRDARELLYQALGRIRENYSSEPMMVTSFYRETIKQNRSYVGVSEAVLDGYKSAYNSLTDSDRVKIFKGRKSTDVKKMDTIMFKLQGGPRTMFLLDIVKNPLELFEREVMEYYIYQMGGIVNIDDRPAYLIEFSQLPHIEYPLYSGKLFIDVETLGFVAADFSINPAKLDQAAQYLVRKKPAGLNVDLINANYKVNYRHSDGLWHLNHTRTELIMAVRWKKKLFRSTYTTISEMAITDIDPENVVKYKYRESARHDDVFQEKVSDFEDPDFWGEYNIIQPEVSIQEAIERISRKLKRRSRD